MPTADQVRAAAAELDRTAPPLSEHTLARVAELLTRPHPVADRQQRTPTA